MHINLEHISGYVNTQLKLQYHGEPFKQIKGMNALKLLLISFENKKIDVLQINTKFAKIFVIN